MHLRPRQRLPQLAIVSGLLLMGVSLYWDRVAMLPTAAVSSVANETTYNPWLRVALTSSPVSSLTLRCDGPVTISLAHSDEVLHEAEKLSSSKISSTQNGIQIGDLHLPATRIELKVNQDPGLRINKHLYRGKIQLFRMRDGRLRVVNVVRLEDYLASVVDSEMPREFGHEARKAQCIAARTYALYQQQQRQSHPYFDLYDSTRSQMYLGVEYPGPQGQRWAGESKSSRRIVEETRGIVCTFEGTIFCTYFSAVCGGRTVQGTDLFSDAESPVRSISCQWCDDAKLHRWERTVSVDQFLKRFDPQNLISSERAFSMNDTASTALDANPKETILIQQDDIVIELERHEIQQRLGAHVLPSPLFKVSLQGTDVVMTGRGHGHGAGFCQWGARGLSQSGKDAQTILQTYYPDSQCVEIAKQ